MLGIGRVERAVARALRLRAPDDPLQARFQALLALGALLAAITLLLQGVIAVVTATESPLRWLRLAANVGYAAVALHVLVGPMRRGDVQRAVTVYAFATALYYLASAAVVGFRHQPQIIAAAITPAMLLALFGRPRALALWATLMLLAVAIGIFGPRQDPGATLPVTQFVSIMLTFVVSGMVVLRHRDHLVGDLREHRARAAELEARNAELQRVIAERDQLAREREGAQRLEAMGRMAGGVAHDFNNILAVLAGHVDLLRESPGVDRADVEEMGGVIDRGARLTAQLLAFARRQASAFVPLDLAALVTELEPMLARAAGTPVRLAIDAPHPVVVRADRSQLEQVLLNLVVNARDAMPDGGTVQLGVHAEARIGGPGIAVLDVRDDGLGMDAAVRERLFEPFFTTRAADGGAGLGLASVYGIVQRHDGTITVESAPGAGARFVITLPLHEGAPLIVAPEELSVPSTELLGRRVLLVEDEAAVRQVLERVLLRAGCVVTVVADGAAALARLPAAARDHDTLVSDIRMPGASGAEVAAAFLHARPDGTVVLISGDHDPALVARIVPAGDVTFLAKPFTSAQLVRALAGAPPDAQRPNQ
ncbi:MAG: ATP-binding protein [Gemmatimonadaceae bacterium]|nr:ATP-binding protein [Gemmatimonadaceae bacterium]